MRRMIMAVLVGGCFLLVGASIPIIGGHNDSELSTPTDAERARWTMADMRTLAIALGAYHLDNSAFPAGETLKDAIPKFEPTYVRKAPVRDAWGTPFKFTSTPDGSGYTLISAGANRRFDESSWSAEGENEEYGEDAVIRNGDFLRTWAYR